MQVGTTLSIELLMSLKKQNKKLETVVHLLYNLTIFATLVDTSNSNILHLQPHKHTPLKQTLNLTQLW